MKYTINFRRFITSLLPFSLRTALSELLWVLVSPMRALHASLMAFKLAQQNKLSYNSQYPNLQRLLNDQFDPIDRKIKVLDNSAIITPIVTYNSGTFGKNIPVTTLSLRSWRLWGYRPFLVLLPISHRDADLINRVKKIVNQYKFAGSKHEIIITE